MAQSRPGGVVARILESEFFGFFTEQETRPAVGLASVEVVGNNPERVGLVVVNTGATQITLGLTPGVGSGLGIVLAAGGDAISLTVRDDFNLVTRAWYGISDLAGGTLYVLELLRVAP